ncbi:MAG: FAD binding domain-containing protein, partial [Paracoccaceae bacterium]
FTYHRPKALPEALQLLTVHGDEARALAGGHSLIPVMKLRMSSISHLVDLQDVPDLRGVTVGPVIRIGAMTTQAELINNAALTAAAPILREAALQIADPQVRNMGTVGGNVANGDPANDMPGLMQCLDATFTLAGPNGTREVKARDFYESAYFTARAEDELLVAMSFAAPTSGYAYKKQKRKIGDYATAAAAVQMAASGGRVTAASIAMTNLSDTPVWSAAAGAALVNTACDAGAIKAAVAAMLGDINPVADNRGPVDFKRHVAGIILGRAINRAFSRT